MSAADQPMSWRDRLGTALTTRAAPSSAAGSSGRPRNRKRRASSAAGSATRASWRSSNQSSGPMRAFSAASPLQSARIVLDHLGQDAPGHARGLGGEPGLERLLVLGVDAQRVVVAPLPQAERRDVVEGVAQHGDPGLAQCRETPLPPWRAGAAARRGGGSPSRPSCRRARAAARRDLPRRRARDSSARSSTVRWPRRMPSSLR